MIEDLDGEIWLPIKGYEGLYMVSNRGRVRSIARFGTSGVLLKINNSDKYSTVVLSKFSRLKTFRIHRLVAQAFLPNPNNYSDVNHKDENKRNNNVENLEWVTHRQNQEHSNIIEHILHKHNAQTIKACDMYDMNGNFIEHFSSLAEAAKKMNFNKSAISACCHNKRVCIDRFTFKFSK